jgi:hypothetical protein
MEGNYEEEIEKNMDNNPDCYYISSKHNHICQHIG